MNSEPWKRRSFVAEQLLAFLSQKTADNRDGMIPFFKYEPAGNKAGPPLVFVGAALAAKCIDVFLGDAIYNSADSGPHARARAHCARFVGGIEDEVG